MLVNASHASYDLRNVANAAITKGAQLQLIRIIELDIVVEDGETPEGVAERMATADDRNIGYAVLQRFGTPTGWPLVLFAGEDAELTAMLDDAGFQVVDEDGGLDMYSVQEPYRR